MLITFFNSLGVVQQHFVHVGQTVNFTFYIIILETLRENSAEKDRKMEKQLDILYHDYVPVFREE
jgi:hypothetical protein